MPTAPTPAAPKPMTPKPAAPEPVTATDAPTPADVPTPDAATATGDTGAPEKPEDPTLLEKATAIVSVSPIFAETVADIVNEIREGVTEGLDKFHRAMYSHLTDAQKAYFYPQYFPELVKKD